MGPLKSLSRAWGWLLVIHRPPPRLRRKYELSVDLENGYNHLGKRGQVDFLNGITSIVTRSARWIMFGIVNKALESTIGLQQTAELCVTYISLTYDLFPLLTQLHAVRGVVVE
ncbi:hypothetical protein B0H19DRAFT_1376927 [Mycena capillaripes]|nr:hypothetical protein B0H19DRAFT_1376927 [Mycena capillaripes]